MGFSITAANAVLTLAIPGVYASAVQIQQFAVDDAFVAEAVDSAEVQVGVDGWGAAGLVPREVPMGIFLMASSPSIVVFENWYNTEWVNGDKLPCSAVILQPSIGRKYTGYQGFLQRHSTMAEVRRVLARREFRLTWVPQGLNVPAISAGPA